MKHFIILTLFSFLAYCSSQETESDPKNSHPSHIYKYVNIDSIPLNYYETVYAPVYSDIYHLDGTKRFQLTTTISIRNTSLTNSADVLSATYHDSYGKTLKEYAKAAIMLYPLESIEFVVEEFDNMGGAGANFIVEWAASQYNNQLMIQSIMIGTYDKQGISFLSEAKVISRTANK